MISAANLLSPPNNIPPKCRHLHPPLSYSLCLSRRLSRRAFWWLCHRRILSAARARPSTPPSTADLPPPPLQRLQTTQNDVSPTLSSHCLLLRCRSVYSEPPRDDEQAIEFRLRKDLILQRNCFSVFGFCWRQTNSTINLRGSISNRPLFSALHLPSLALSVSLTALSLYCCNQGKSGVVSALLFVPVSLFYCFITGQLWVFLDDVWFVSFGCDGISVLTVFCFSICDGVCAAARQCFTGFTVFCIDPGANLTCALCRAVILFWCFCVYTQVRVLWVVFVFCFSSVNCCQLTCVLMW